MFPQYANLQIDLWVHPERLGISQPAICLFRRTSTDGAAILEAVNELLIADCPAQRLLTFARCDRSGHLSEMRLISVPEQSKLRVMNIRREATVAIIEATTAGLMLLSEAATAWLAGAEDFCRSARHAGLKQKEYGSLDRESGELWFWGPTWSP